jgi:hypothetical protein
MNSPNFIFHNSWINWRSAEINGEPHIGYDTYILWINQNSLV